MDSDLRDDTHGFVGDDPEGFREMVKNEIGWYAASEFDAICASLSKRAVEPWTDAVLVEKVARGLYELAMAPDPYPFSWDDATTPREAWRDEARRVLGEPS